MTSIWNVFLQTIEVSMVAGILLLIKWLLKDKLSARWQYSVWIVLLVSILIPAGYFHLYIVPKLNIYIETIKVMIEKLMDSSYISVYETIYNYSIIPIIKELPKSITDYLFIIYVIGIIVNIIRCVSSYIHLRLSLKQGIKVNEEKKNQIQRVCQQYHLKDCKIILLKHLPSPFVFGVLHPTLVLPYDKDVDDKVILHELLHLKYRDSLQCMIWAILKSLHWFNPFLKYVFDMVKNDMESLCDYRVLELLEGEERREYGKILLSMTNDKYPYSFGTTSISNGGLFMKTRIEAIVRFKKYPQGMKLVSVCILILLLPIALGGTVSSEWIEIKDRNQDSFAYELSMSSARMYYCSSLAGAIDTYAKGVLTHNDLYLTSVMPVNKQLDYKRELRYIPSDIQSLNNNELYRVIGLEKVGDEEYKAQLLFYQLNEIENINNETQEEVIDDYVGMIKEYTYVLLPISIINENGWKVFQNGEMIRDSFNDIDYDGFRNKLNYKTITKEYDNISIKIDIQYTQYIPEVEYSSGGENINYLQDNASGLLQYLSTNNFSYTPITNNTFARSYRKINITLEPKIDDYTKIGFMCVPLDDINDNVHMKMGEEFYNEYGSACSSEGDWHTYEKQHFERTINHYNQIFMNDYTESCHFENEELLLESDSQIYGVEVMIDDVLHEFTFDVREVL